MMKLEYKGYILEIEEEYNGFKTKCDESTLSFINGAWKGCSLYQLVSRFRWEVDNLIKSFEYKGYLLKLGLIEDNYGQKRKGGYCKELDYKTYGEDEEANITKFKKYINWKISEEKKQLIPNSLERIEQKLDKLADIFTKEKSLEKFVKRFYQIYGSHPIGTHGKYPDLVRELLDELKKLETNS